uniref:protein-tyrosine-phosphatase n=1 Tax=Mus musculus TaxID=10090 RepID=A0A2I3BPS7_MOUSE|nr:unnamed protein product [Mus musculus]BAC28238.1 unnamed protein product [Mus musculus]
MKPPISIQASEFDSSDEEPVDEEQTPIQISWLPLSRVNCSQFLGLCALPGCKFKDVRRNIQKDTEELKSYGIQDVFVFCTRGELSKYRVPNLLDLYQQYGIVTHHHPIPDGGTPDIGSCWEIMEELATCLKNNRKTLIQYVLPWVPHSSSPSSAVRTKPMHEKSTTGLGPRKEALMNFLLPHFKGTTGHKQSCECLE